MSEYLEKIKTKQNFNSRLNPEIVVDIERLTELHFDITGEEIISDKMLLETALDSALTKRKPIEVSKPEDLQKIQQLEMQVQKISDSSQNIIKEYYANKEEYTLTFESEKKQFTQKIEELQNEIAQLKTAKDLVNDTTHENAQLLQRIAELESNAQPDKPETMPDAETIIVHLNNFQKGLIEAYLNDKEVIALFERGNNNGQATGMQDLINTPNKNVNAANLLTTVFCGSAYGRVLKPIYTTNQIKQAFKNWRDSNND